MLKVIELFAGVGGWAKALNNLKIETKTFPIEVDKDTLSVYKIINKDKWDFPYPTVDITNHDFSKIDFEVDIIFMSPPCQGFSNARQNGYKEKNNDRDNLINHTLPIVQKVMPRYVIVENVPNFRKSYEFKCWLVEMYQLGYKVKIEILNPLEHNWPQNRKRMFAIFFKNQKDFDNYQWPKKEPFTNTLDKIIDSNNLTGNFVNIKDLPSNAKLRKNGNGYIWGNYIDNRCYLPNRYIGTITATFNQPWILIGTSWPEKIRQLNWQECFLLMGYTQEDINKIYHLNLSDSKYKKMAGNGLVIPLIEKIIKPLNLGNDYD